MSADRDYEAGTRFARHVDMNSKERKALDWMDTVKSTRIESKANLKLRWIDGNMTYEATEEIKKGKTFLLYGGHEESTAKRDGREKSEEINTTLNSSRSSSRRSSRAKPNYKLSYTSDEDTSPHLTRAGTKRTSKTENVTDEKEETDNKQAKRSKRNSNPEKKSKTDPTSDESDNDYINDDNDSSYKNTDTESQHSNSESNSSKSSPKVYAASEAEAESDEKNSNKSDESDQSESDDDPMVPQKFTCKVCSKIFASVNVLKEHKKVHVASVKMHFCKYCKRAFVYEKSLNEHLKDEHGKKGSSKGNVTTDKKLVPKKSPKKSKRPKKNFVCDECGKEFRWQTSFDDHVAIHAKKFVCKICDKIFGKEIFLDNHMAGFHKQKPDAKKYAQTPSKTPNKRGRKSKRKLVEIEDDDDEKEDEPTYKVKRCYVKLVKLDNEGNESESEEEDENGYDCFECGINFPKERVWLNHMKKLHPKK